MKKIVIFIIFFYQKIFSPDTGILSRANGTRQRVCVFYPSCSEYFKETVIKYGPYQGFLRGGRRILRCHPWQRKHIDEVK